ncbi:MAG TPA: hypothetical protein VHL11_09575 [Phototrophicaceae bacterium]|jgi:WD40 repeat protein|nr:hypothetical protein [Phototrophicaceae bacterium]
MVLRTVKQLTLPLLIVMIFSTVTAQQGPYKSTPYLTWNPKMNILAMGDENDILSIVDGTTGQVLNTFVTTQFPDTTINPAWSQDGGKIAFSNGYDVEVWENPWDQAKAKQVSRYQYYYDLTPPEPLSATPRENTWKADGLQIATVIGELIDVWDVSTGNRLYRFSGKQRSTSALAWGSGGELISGGNLGRVILWNLETGTPKKVLSVYESNSFPDPQVLALSLRPGTDEIAAGAYDNTIRIWDTSQEITLVDSYEYSPSTLRDISLTDNLQVPVISVAWSPDGRYIASGEQQGKVRIYDVSTGALEDTVEVAPNAQIFSVTWSPYGAQLAFGGVVGETPALPRNMPVRSIANGTVHIVVPYASLEQLQTISGQCLTDAPAPLSENNFLKMESVSKLTLSDLPGFVTQIKTLPVDAIPPACAADLIAVAEALIAS